MASLNTEVVELPTFEDSLAHIRGNYNELFPITESRRKTIGNLPVRLHTAIAKMASDRNLCMFEILAGMVDFYEEYEATYAEQLTAQRLRNQTTRR